MIEVMGLAILPARLKEEMELLKTCLLGRGKIEDYPQLDKHTAWYETLQKQTPFTEENAEQRLRQALTDKYVQVLEDAGVFKMNQSGIQAFSEFVNTATKGV